MATLNLNSNYAEQMLSLYLWGQTTAPTPSELADDKWIRPSDATSIAEVDAGAYMATVGSHLSLASQKIFQLFFNNEYRTGGKVELSDIANTGTKNGNEIVLNHKQFVGLLYGKLNRDDPEQAKIYNSAEKAELNLYHYRTNTDSEDYWQRAFTFGSSKFKLDTSSIKYVFDANTGKAIRLDDVQVQPLDTFDGIRENFDFESNQGIAKLVNPILNKIMDPSGIGRKVNIEFTDNDYFSLPSGSSYTQENYRDHIKENSQPISGRGYVVYPETPTEELINVPELFSFWKGLKKLSESKIYDFLDENGKVVIYGSQEEDFITEYNAKNFSLDSKVTAYGMPIPNWLLFNTFEKHLKNGITYIGGSDNDVISGTDYDDYVYGNDGQDDLRGQKGDDTLIGGLDADTLYGGDGDDILIGGINENTVKDNNAQNTLYGEAGNDTLKGSGRLEGGKGFDTYFAYNTAIINDKDGLGRVHIDLNGSPTLLIGGVHKLGANNNTYESVDGKITYVWDKKTHTLKVNDGLTIEDWSNGDLGITLKTGQDIAFVVDISGSMGDNITAVVSQVDRFMQLLFNHSDYSKDTRVAVAAYEQSTIIVEPFTEHATVEARKAAASKALAQLPNMIYGSTEYVYHALYNILSGQAGQWREDAAARTVVLIGDEPGDDQDFASQAYALARDLNATLNISTRSTKDVTTHTLTFNDNNSNKPPVSVNITTIFIGNGSFKDTANQTGGIALQSTGVQDIADVLFEALQIATPYDDVLSGDDRNNQLQAKEGNDTLNGYHGDDILDGGLGEDTMIGGQGNDTYYVDNTNDQVIEHIDEGIDTINASIDYTLDDNSNIEHLNLIGSATKGIGNNIDNIITGNALDNILDGKAGNDTLIGGKGNDIYYIDSINDMIIENINEGIDGVIAATDYTLTANLENLTLANTALKAIGNELDNVLKGNELANILMGNAGDDILIATRGADILDGGVGKDIYDFDTLSLNDGLTKTIKDSDLSGNIRINGQYLNNIAQKWQLMDYNLTAQEYTWTDGQDHYIHKNNQGYTITSSDFTSSILIATDAQADNILGLELTLPTRLPRMIEAKNHLSLGTLGNDIITIRDNKAHTINTFFGDDVINGGNKDDILNGEIGNDIILGNLGNDKLYGGLGNDILNGGQGNDYLNGSYGNDIYVYNAGDGKDIIRDIAGSDTLDLSSFSLNDLVVDKHNKDLVINFTSDTTSQDSITIKHWDNTAYQIEKVILSDTILNNMQLTSMIG